MKLYNPDLDVTANWQNADALDFAWFVYSVPELQQSYRDYGGTSRATSLVLQFEMQFELRQRIAEGEFTAFGISVDMTSGRELAIIPPIFFASESVKILWDRNEMTGLGKMFAEVRICTSVPNTATAASSEIEQSNAAEPVAQKERQKNRVGPRGAGRKNLYPQARTVLAELFEDPGYAAMTASPLLETFNSVFVDRYSVPGRRIAAISERSLRTYLEQFRQELAESGKN